MRTRIIRSLYAAALAWTLALTPSAFAVEPDEMLKDPALEGRARAISSGLRCLVCQNQSIDDSNAGLARDLRILVRERLTKGDSDAQVVDFLVSRYGEFVLLKPRLAPHNYILWFGPAIVLALGLLLARRAFRSGGANGKDKTPETAGLTAAEETQLKALLDRNKEA